MQKDFSPVEAFDPDEVLIARARSQDSGALSELIARYLASGKALARGFHAAGLEPEDLTQEALLGLIKAVRSYDTSRGIPFAPYASLCMRRQLLSAVKSAGASKHRPLSDYVPLDDSGTLSYPTGDSRTESPESIVIMDEDARRRGERIQSLLSAFEHEALNLYLAGLSHAEMADRMKATPKSVDNALQRVKRKLRSIKL